jgi:hypothetical protein
MWNLEASEYVYVSILRRLSETKILLKQPIHAVTKLLQEVATKVLLVFLGRIFDRPYEN